MSSLLVQRLKSSAVLPAQAGPLSAGYDLSAADAVTIPAKGRAVVGTGIAVSVPPLHYGRVAPRSGLTVKHGLDVGAGVVDSSYVGEVMVVLFNHSDADYHVGIGDRIAQLILERISTPNVLEVSALRQTSRGQGGFGSTGK